MKIILTLLLAISFSSFANEQAHNINLSLEYGAVKTNSNNSDEGYARYALGYKYSFNDNWALESRFLQGFSMSVFSSDAAMSNNLIQVGAEYRASISDLNRWVVKAGANQYLLNSNDKDEWENNRWEDGIGYYISTGLRTEFKSGFDMSWLISYDKYKPSDNLGLSFRVGYSF